MIAGPCLEFQDAGILGFPAHSRFVFGAPAEIQVDGGGWAGRPIAGCAIEVVNGRLAVLAGADDSAT
jgi:hypothetical protein